MSISKVRNILIHNFTSSTRAGFLKTVKILFSRWRDRNFDRKYQVETSIQEDPKLLEPDHPSSQDAVIYGPTREQPFLRLFQKVNIDKEGTFVDLGCGKGRAMMLAALYGFKQVKGVEFSSKLCDRARDNLKKFSKQLDFEFHWTVLNENMSSFSIQPDDRVFYFFDPAGDNTLKNCLNAILKDLEKNPRSVFFIYHNNLLKDQNTFNDLLTSFSHKKYEVLGNSFYVYWDEPESMTISSPRSEKDTLKPADF